MEDLQLPMDLLIWDGKSEPDSPSTELFDLPNSEESWCFEDDFAKEILLSDVTIDEKIGFDNSENEDVIFEFEYDVKNEQWLDAKPAATQPLETSAYITHPHFSEVQVVKLQNSELATELENLCNVSELTQLTPPQTPPQNPNYINEILDFIAQQTTNSNITENAVIEEIIQAASPTSSYVDYSSDTTNSPASPDYSVITAAVHGSQIVDEILRTRARDLPDCNDDNSMNSIASGTSGMSQQSNDSEWTPSGSPASKYSGDNRSLSASPTPTHSSGSNTSLLSSGGITKKRVRPYSRNVEDKKSRKKEQNKNAATRYRQKKKQEMEEILEEERQLVVRNEELVRNATEVEREVKYLKKLIKEFFRSKFQ